MIDPKISVSEQWVKAAIRTMFWDEAIIAGLRTTVSVMRATITERTAERDAAVAMNKGNHMTRSLSAIAKEIRSDWGSQGKGVNYAAKPYLDAMSQLDSIGERFYEDDGKSVVLYFLSNAQSWRGEVAKRVKAELNLMAKGA